MLQEYGLAKADEARALLEGAEAAARGRGDADGQVEALRVLVDILLAKKDFAEAISLAEKAASIPTDKSKQAKGQCLVAQIHASRGDGFDAATMALGKAVSLYKEARDAAGEADATGMLSQLHLEVGDVDTAMSHARSALELSRGATMAMLTLAQVYLRREQQSAAIEQATEMLAACKDKGDKAGQASASQVLANALLFEEGNLEGLKRAREALALYQEVNDVYGKQSALHTLANGYFARSDLEEGLKCAREALACCRQTGDTDSMEELKGTIEQARLATQEWRKTYPKRPFVLPHSAKAPAPPAGPQKCPVAEVQINAEDLDNASVGRKYWGVPVQVEADPSVDADERAPSHTVVWGGCLSDYSPTQINVEFSDLVACMAKGEVAKVPIVVLTKGVYGRQTGNMHPASMNYVAAATIWGFVRTVRQEIPAVTIQLLDFSEGYTAAEIPRSLRPFVAEAAFYGKAHWEPQIAAVPSLFRRDLRRDNLTNNGTAGREEEKEKKPAAKFQRKSFNWMGPNNKMDFCWYRQEWRACGPAFADVGPMPPPPPCLAARAF